MHGSFVVAVLIATALAVRVRRAGWLLASLAVLILLNATAHVVTAAFVPSARSGFLTSVFIWTPLGVFALAHSWRQLSRQTLWAAILAGIASQVLLTWLAASA